MNAKWPVYRPDHPTVSRVGVVSVNFANFERAVTWMFAAIAQKSEDDARKIHKLITEIF